MKKEIKLLIVDDSPLMRKVLLKLFEPVQQIDVVGTAENGLEALDQIEKLGPDVVILDINMPKMDGITTLKHIMINRPLPTVMFSTLTKNGAYTTFKALKYGAVDFIHKPSNYQSSSVENQSVTVVNKIIMAAGIEIRSIRYTRPIHHDFKAFGSDKQALPCEYFCAIGTSEGGYGTLLKIIPHIRPDLPMAFVVLLHEPSAHVDNFTGYLDQESLCRVKRVQDGEPLKAGRFYMASNEEQVCIIRNNGIYALSVENNVRHDERKGIDHLMTSLSSSAGSSSVGVLLTGSGRDGLAGINEIIRQGGTSIIQEPRTCLQKERCREVIHSCTVDMVIPDIQIAHEINTSFFL